MVLTFLIVGCSFTALKVSIKRAIKVALSTLLVIIPYFQLELNKKTFSQSIALLLLFLIFTKPVFFLKNQFATNCNF